MSTYLLDTCTFLWLNLEPEALSDRAREICQDIRNSMLLSPVSVWEIELKFRMGNLALTVDPPSFIRQFRSLHLIDTVPFEEEDAFLHAGLPFHHKDPFDRMLICQAIARNIPLLTPDDKISKYAVQTIW
ncbi:MAG: type II toxin-antitoxin system VapC family toxin [Bacteroidota bacterium]